jgi:hypothetical protein
MIRSAGDLVGFEQDARCLALAAVRGDEVEVADGAVEGAEQEELEAPVAARVGGAVAEAGPGGKLAAPTRRERLAAGKRGRVEQAQLVVGAERLGRQCLPEHKQLRYQPAGSARWSAAARAGRGRGGPAVCGRGAGRRGRADTAGTSGRPSGSRLVVWDQLRAATPPLLLGRKERAGGARDCDHEGVKVGAYGGLRVDGVGHVDPRHPFHRSLPTYRQETRGLRELPINHLGSAIRQAVDGTAWHALGLPGMDEDTA